MTFFERLQKETEQERSYLLSAPIISNSLKGNIVLDEYVAFLCQAYHHVKHTTPLLMACGSRLSSEQEWLRTAIAEYIEEELGHQEWVLNDIAACAYDKEFVRHSKPHASTELMVSYAYDMINRVNPLGFFGMVFVLEGTSVSIADNAAASMQAALGLPDHAFSYLSSHGSLDQEHVAFFEGLMNQLETPQDQAIVIHCAKVFYKLYGDIFRSLTSQHDTPVLESR